VDNVRIHDLRHAGATILMTLGVPDPIVRKVTGHRSRELERYQHLTPELRALTVNLIATELFRGKRARKERESGTSTGTVRSRRVTKNSRGANVLELSEMLAGSTGLEPAASGVTGASLRSGTHRVLRFSSADRAIVRHGTHRSDTERHHSAAKSGTPAGTVLGEGYEAFKSEALTAAGTSIATKRSAENR
jgi:hypothetical protein